MRGTTTTALARLRPRTYVLVALVVLLVAAVAALGATTLAWGNTLRDEGRLLPGTTIATVPVSDATSEEAVAAVEDHLAAQLDAVVRVTYEDRAWETTARQLGATTDVEALVDEALARTAAAEFTELVRMRWLGETADTDLEVHVEVPEDAVAAFVAAAADEVDRDVRDARVTYEDGGFEVRRHRDGRATDRDRATADLLAALADDTDVVELPVTVTPATVDTATAEEVVADVSARVDAALDHEVTVTLESDQETVTPRELGAVADVEPLLAAALAGLDATPASAGDDGDRDGGEVQLDLPGGALTAVIDRLAAGKERAARDATVEFDGEGFQVTEGVDGRAVDRDEARSSLRAALRGGADHVELNLHTIEAEEADTSGRVLVLRQSARMLDLYVDGVKAREWPVAVGTGGSPTPTGTFTVGAKRYEPTWVNPAPDRWGADMPARIGPGPDNPLGVRALNWNNSAGGDTLIRFHGTPNEASIGSASSNGCVRMFNSDVVELYDLVASGDTIISMG